MNHQEQLIAEWYEYQGYFIRRNTRVGPLPAGGYEGELDIVAYHPKDNRLVHIESAIDGISWKDREIRFQRKFEVGKKYIPKLFHWLDPIPEIEPIALLWASSKNYPTIGGGKVLPFRIFMKEIVDTLKGLSAINNAISEQYPLLRAIQFAIYFGL